MYYFIVNTRSGNGKSKRTWKHVKSILEKENIKYKAYATLYAGHATKLAKGISQLDDDDIRIVILGGDGTINEVINGITDLNKVKIGLVPSGSGNDFARGIGLTGELEDILYDVLQYEEDDMVLDVGKVSYTDVEGYSHSRLYAISSGIGLDAIVCKKTVGSVLKKRLNKIKLGKLTYLVYTVETLFLMSTFKADMCVDGEQQIRNDVIFMANMNTKAEGGGVRMAPDAVPYSGDMTMCAAANIPKWKTFFFLPLLVVGKHKGIKGIDIFKNKNCKIVTDKPVTLHADGEYLGEVIRIEYECLESKLRMLNKVI